MNKNIKKIGKAVAGSALLVGATLTGAAGLASAASGSQDLGDYPTPFVNDDGDVQSTVVVGDSAKTVNVVGAVNIAGSLGNAAFGEETVSVGSGASASWSATNGITLNRPNSNLFLNDAVNTQIDTADSRDLENVLAPSQFQLANGDTVETDFEVRVDDQAQDFSTAPRGLDDPELHVDVPTRSSVDSNDYLMEFTAEMDTAVDFTSNGDLEDGDEIELFGETYTVNPADSDTDTLALYGSSQTVSLQSGDEQTFTINGEEHTVELVGVTSSGAAFRVDGGSIKQRDEGGSVTVDGQEVRVSSIVDLQDDNGYADFSIGSEEVELTHGQNVRVNGDRVRGTHVVLNDGDSTPVESLDTVQVYTGAQDRDNDYLAAGDSYTAPLFDAVEVHYGGLAANAAEDPAEMIDVTISNNENAEVTFTDDNGNEETVTFENADNQGDLGDADGNIATVEGETLGVDDYVILNQDRQSGMYQVVDVFFDSDVSPNEGELVLENVFTGNTVEVSEDDMGSSDTIQGERIDGVRYDITFDSQNSASIVRQDRDDTVIYPNLYTETDGAVAFTDTTAAPTGAEADVTASEFSGSDSSASAVEDSDGDGDVTVSFTGAGSEAEVSLLDANGDEVGSGTVQSSGTAVTVGTSVTVEEVSVSSADGTVESVDVVGDGTSGSTGTFGSAADPVAGSVNTDFRFPSTKSTGDATVAATYDALGSEPTSIGTASADGSTFDVGEMTLTYTGSNEIEVNGEPSAHVMEPQDDNDQENVHTFTASDDSGDLQLDSPSYSDDGDEIYTSGFDSQDDLTAGYTVYGTYREYDTSGQGSVDLSLPAAQSTSGVALTENGGSVSAGSAGSVTASTPMGWPDAAALDSDSNIDTLKTSDELILVGGPSVNALTQELADEGKTQAASEYEEGTAMVEVVNDAFAEGQDAIVVAGYSGEDTRQAANYLANYADNSEDLAGQTQVELSTQQTQSAE